MVHCHAFSFLLLQYLGCVEVFESRGMQVCEEAIKVLKVRLKSILKKRPEECHYNQICCEEHLQNVT